MQLFSLLSIFLSIATFFSTSLSAPVNYVHHPATSNLDDAVDKRQVQVLVEVAAILNAAEAVIKALENIIDEISGDIQDAEGKFTRDMVSNLQSQYPTMNVLVFHNKNCGYNLYSATHAHVEMDIGLGFSQGYEVWVFDYGTFELVGDGGYSNWAIGGSFSGPSSDVTFYSMNGN